MVLIHKFISKMFWKDISKPSPKTLLPSHLLTIISWTFHFTHTFFPQGAVGFALWNIYSLLVNCWVTVSASNTAVPSIFTKAQHIKALDAICIITQQGATQLQFWDNSNTSRHMKYSKIYFLGAIAHYILCSS